MGISYLFSSASVTCVPNTTVRWLSCRAALNGRGGGHPVVFKVQY